MSTTLIHHDTFDSMQLNIDTKIEEGDNVLTCDLSVKNKLLFFIDQLPLIKFDEEESYILLDVKNNPEYKKLFHELDTRMILHIQENEITKRYNLKKFDYISFINSYTNIEGVTTDVVKFKVNLSNSDSRTNFFYKYGQSVEDLNILKNKNNTILVKTILECMKLTFDLTNKNIYIDNCVRQLKIKVLDSQEKEKIEELNIPEIQNNDIGEIEETEEYSGTSDNMSDCVKNKDSDELNESDNSEVVNDTNDINKTNNLDDTDNSDDLNNNKLNDISPDSHNSNLNDNSSSESNNNLREDSEEVLDDDLDDDNLIQDDISKLFKDDKPGICEIIE